MGNTLLDFHCGLSDEEKDLLGLEAMKVYLESIGVYHSVQSIKSLFLDGLYSQFHKRVSDLIEIDVRPYIDRLGDFSDEQVNRLLEAFYAEYQKTVVVNDNAIALLSCLKEAGLMIGIISNCFLPAFIYKQVFVSKGLDQFIDHYTFSYSHGIRKPNPNLFRVALKANKMSATDVIMIGDGLKADIMGGSALGIEGIWYNNKDKKNHESVECLLEIKNFSQLL